MVALNKLQFSDTHDLDPLSHQAWTTILHDKAGSETRDLDNLHDIFVSQLPASSSPY